MRGNDPETALPGGGSAQFVCVVIVVLAGAGAVAGADWPRWRGPAGDGTTPEPTGWRKGARLPKTPAWTFNAGEGCSSPVVVGGRIYATGWREHRDTLYCLDAATGREIWRQSCRSPRYGRHAVGDQGQYSGPVATPLCDTAAGLVYTLTTDGGLHCRNLKKEGAPVWGANLYARYRQGRRPATGGGRRDYGYTTAPLLAGGNLLVQAGGRAGTVVALDPRTGAHRWSSQCRDHAGHAGGMVPLRIGGVPCVAALSLQRLLVMRIDRGREGRTLCSYSWRVEFANGIPSPAVAGDRVLLTAAYDHKETVCLAVAAGGIRPRWTSPHYSGVCTPVVHEGKVYTAHRELRCLDLATGELVWKGGDFGADGSCLVAGDGRLVVFGNGRLAIAEGAGRSPKRYRELAAVTGICRRGDAWPHVVLAGGRIYCKDRRGIIRCYRIGWSRN